MLDEKEIEKIIWKYFPITTYKKFSRNDMENILKNIAKEISKFKSGIKMFNSKEEK